MIYQTDKRLRLKARDDECYLFCILDIFESFTKYTFTIKEIDTIHRLLVRLDYIRIDGWINERGVQGIAQVASVISGKHCYMKLVDESQSYTAIIARYSRKTGKSNLVTHFVRMYISDSKKIQYDPYDEKGSKTVREGKITGYRYIFAEVI